MVRHQGEPLHVIEVCAGLSYIAYRVLRRCYPGLEVNTLPKDVLKRPQRALPARTSPQLNVQARKTGSPKLRRYP